MKQIEFFHIENPCKNICINGEKGLCIGCFRTREERQHWKDLDDFTKKQITRACVMRKRRFELIKKKTSTQTIEITQLDIFDEGKDEVQDEDEDQNQTN
ncbi:DUF1289 domain-containing protein [Marinicellulosiphila megalodicopiae]|uniref:DUF1289 domain-containing protein n=1 Tax=Marinicellulosiphila megalodicopiae TaxID=2724896 RepID=UPI003BB1F64A